MLHAKADRPKKNIMRNEGIEKKVPERKDSMKKNSFLQEITPPPFPNQKLNGWPLKSMMERIRVTNWRSRRDD